MKTSFALISATTLLFASATLPVNLHAETYGSTTSDAASLVGEFIVNNPSNTTIKYQVKWGNNGTWQKFQLAPHRERKHSHPLKDDRAPTPYLRFDDVGGDGKTTFDQIHMEFGKVGYSGYNSKGYINEAIRYDFKYQADGRHIDLVQR